LDYLKDCGLFSGELSQVEELLDQYRASITSATGQSDYRQKYRDTLAEVSQYKGWGEELLQSVKELKCDNIKCGVHSSITGETYWCQICSLQQEYGVDKQVEAWKKEGEK